VFQLFGHFILVCTDHEYISTGPPQRSEWRVVLSADVTIEGTKRLTGVRNNQAPKLNLTLLAMQGAQIFFGGERTNERGQLALHHGTLIIEGSQDNYVTLIQWIIPSLPHTGICYLFTNGTLVGVIDLLYNRLGH
jgi:hypothetical protein